MHLNEQTRTIMYSYITQVIHKKTFIFSISKVFDLSIALFLMVTLDVLPIAVGGVLGGLVVVGLFAVIIICLMK